MLNPSDELVNYFLSRPEVKTGNRITSQMIEKHREITRQAMQKVFGVQIQSVLPCLENDDTGIISESHDVFPDMETPLSVQDISGKLQNILRTIIPDFLYVPEDSDDYLRLHIYTSSNKKVGNVKILKSDFSIQWKKTGSPETHILQSEEDIRKYI